MRPKTRGSPTNVAAAAGPPKLCPSSVTRIHLAPLVSERKIPWSATAHPVPRARNTLRSACLPFLWTPFTGMSKRRGRDACPARGHREAVHVPRLELVSFDPDGCSLCLGPNHPARGHELQRTYAIQHRRPVHAQLHYLSHRQLVFSGEQNSAAPDVQRASDAADPGF